MAGEPVAPDAQAPIAGSAPESPQDQLAPAATPDAAPPARPTIDVRALQAGYTQNAQALATIRRELGLPREATQQEIVAAIAASKQRPAYVEYDDPELARKAADLQEREYRMLERVWGREIVSAARTVTEVVLQGGTPEEIVLAINEAAQAQRSADSPGEQSQQAQPAAPEASLIMERGVGGPPTAPPSPSEAGELAGTGRIVDYVRRLARGNV